MIMRIVVCILLLFVTIDIHAQQKMFTEVATECGLDYIYPGNDFQMAGGGVLVIDVNNDGWEDLFQSGGVFESKLWINEHGKFRDATSEFKLDVLIGYFIQGAIAADIDNDGFRDFVVANYGTGMGRGDKHSPVIMHNVSGKYFEKMSLDEVLEPGNFTSACWGDINNDGFVDLYLTNYIASMGGITNERGQEVGYDATCFENKFLLNQGGKSFVECSKSFGINDGGCGLAASFTDADSDGDLDLILLNDFGEWTGMGNRFFRNEFPKTFFTDQTDSTGFNAKMYGMGIGQGDFDQDGDLDYYLTNIGKNQLMQNTNGKFTDVANENHVDLTYVRDSICGTSWSGLFFDLEFDGDLDLYVSKGNVATLVPKTVIKDPNKLFVNQNGQFIDSSLASGVDDILSHRGAVVLDFDHDGDLDIVSSVVKLPWSAFAHRDQKIKLYRNDLQVGNFVGIRLIGEGIVNRDCIGCKVLFVHRNGKTMREVDGSSGQASQSTPILYFGIGEETILGSVTIYWTDGTSTTLNALRSGFIYEVNSKGKIKKVKLD